MDFITCLPKSKGKTTIMVVVDRLSKYAHFSPLAKGFTAESVAGVFARDNCRLHGIPTYIISDRDPVLLSSFWQELFCHKGTVLAHSTTYHPQSDDLNRILQDYLWCYVGENQLKWVDMLLWAELHYNTATSLGARHLVL
ncbi:unnamed protein product [Rhodiola kirilowii]